MVDSTQAASPRRGRGRPIGADSAETRATILRAARAVISERGYEAATFQAIATRARLSRPTLHYYFAGKEEIYDILLQEAHSVVVASVAAAKVKETLLEQLAAFTATARDLGFADGSMMRFVVAARLEQHRHPGLRGRSTPVTETMADFYGWVVDDAVRRGEIDAQVDGPAVVNMLSAIFWGVGFFGAFVSGRGHGSGIAKQLNALLRRGLLQPPSDTLEAPSKRLAV